MDHLAAVNAGITAKAYIRLPHPAALTESQLHSFLEAAKGVGEVNAYPINTGYIVKFLTEA